jgi:hypothetical protein
MSTATLKLTKREQAIMALFDGGSHWDEDDVNEGLVYDKHYPFIANVRLVTNSLKRKGLIEFGSWNDDGCGCDLRLTSAGRAWRAAASGGGDA